MRRTLFALVFAGAISFLHALEVPKEWVEAYEQGRKDEREKIVRELEQTKEILLAILKYKQMLLGGLIPPPLAVDTYSVDKTTGTMEIKRTTKIINPASIDFTALAKLRVDLTKGVKLRSGWWVYLNTQDLSDYEVGYLKNRLMKLGYEPVVWKDVLVASFERKKATAEDIARRISSELGIEFSVAKVDLNGNESAEGDSEQ